MRLRPLATNVGLSLAVLALTLAAAEAVARILLGRRGGGKEQNEFAQYQVYDPVLGWRDKPNARVVFFRREYEEELRTNGQGLRDRERSYEGSAFRVLALGDSFVEGYSVPFEATVTQVIEQDLNEPGCPFEVINAGVANYSTDQEYLAYRSEGVRYQPRIVVLFFYYNDVLATISSTQYGRPKPVLDFRSAPAIVANQPVPPPPPPVAAPRPAPSRGGSVLWSWTQERLQHRPRVYKALAAIGLVPPFRPTYPPREMAVYWRRATPEVDRAWRQVDRILGALASETSAHGSRLLVAYIPSRFEVNDRDLELTRLWYGLDEASWGRAPVLRRLRSIADARAFPVLDLTPALRGVDRSWQGPYYQYDGHWNVIGHRAAGLAVSQWLRARGWLPPCARASTGSR
jgi:GDSL-like Lipase/Acylhydrolase family